MKAYPLGSLRGTLSLPVIMQFYKNHMNLSGGKQPKVLRKREQNLDSDKKNNK